MERNTTQIEHLARRYNACADAIAWAIKECVSAAAIWCKANPDRLLWIATRQEILTDDQLRTFAEWALLNTPPKSQADQQRIRACLDGSDRLTYPQGVSRERWAALAIVSRGRLPMGSIDDTRAAQAAFLRSLVKQPFEGNAA